MALPEDAAAPPARLAPGEGDLGQLTRAIRAGDAAAFARFYDAHAFGIYKYLLVLAQGDELAAREVFQTVAVKLATKMEVFERGPALQAWLRRVTRNAFIDHCRRCRRDHRHVPLDGVELPMDGVAPSQQRLRDALARALEDCAAGDREMLNAIYLDGLPIAVVAEQQGVTYKALESRLARLRLQVRQNLLAKLRHE